ncbi:MAG: rod shape-determining protein MreC [Elusimicrobia bacterium]|nr:rod shape-determining protein MreC [Elusimicrobiota bacterium]
MQREARIANYFLAVFGIISLTLLSLPLSGPVRVFKACLVYLSDPAAYRGAKGVEKIADVPDRIRGLLAADIENRLMREEVKEASWARAEAQALKAENERLRAVLGLKASPGYTSIWARVLERDPLHWYHSFMVDAGQKDGLALNAPVLGKGAEGLSVIGRVVEVRPRSSLVLLVTDELSSVAAHLSSSTVEGLAQGQGGARLIMNYLSEDASLTLGDLAYTSATSATFPPGILIGRVARVFPRDPFLTFQSVEISPALDSGRLSEVLILKRQGSP